MNLTSFLVKKCFEYLLKCDAAEESVQAGAQQQTSNTSTQLPIQPPWAKNSKEFSSHCDGCGECVSACDNSILVINGNGYPQVDFSLGSCSFCGACADSCPKKLFHSGPEQSPWDLVVHINSGCLTNNSVICSACAEHCDREAITIPLIIDKGKSPVVSSGLCNGCGACFKVCPVNAVEIFQRKYREQP